MIICLFTSKMEFLIIFFFFFCQRPIINLKRKILRQKIEISNFRWEFQILKIVFFMIENNFLSNFIKRNSVYFLL